MRGDIIFLRVFLEVLDKRHVFEFKLEQRSRIQYFIYLEMSVGFRKYLQTALMFSDFLFSLRGVQSINHVRLTSMSVLERGEGRGVATKKKNCAQITFDYLQKSSDDFISNI